MVDELDLAKFAKVSVKYLIVQSGGLEVSCWLRKWTSCWQSDKKFMTVRLRCWVMAAALFPFFGIPFPLLWHHLACSSSYLFSQVKSGPCDWSLHIFPLVFPSLFAALWCKIYFRNTYIWKPHMDGSQLPRTHTHAWIDWLIAIHLQSCRQACMQLEPESCCVVACRSIY